jgi:hypothetical protein
MRTTRQSLRLEVTMTETARRKATYEDLCALPERMTGEIINGELIATPRPSADHTFTASVMGNKLTPTFHFGEGGGPGGWIILHEPEIMLGEDLLVPDLAGWRKADTPMEKSNRTAISWFLTWQAGGRSTSPAGRKKTGFQLPQIGSARCSHRLPHVWTGFARCPSMPGTLCTTFG